MGYWLDLALKSFTATPLQQQIIYRNGVPAYFHHWGLLIC